MIIVHQGALGDFLLALPAMEGLHRIYPDIRMDFWSRREHVALIAGRPYVRDVYSCDGPELSPFFHDDLWLEARIPSCFRKAQAVLIFGQSSGRLLAARLGERLKSPVYWVQSFTGDESGRSVSESILEQMQQHGWQMDGSCPSIECSEEERSIVKDWLAEKDWLDGPKPLLVHPGSGARRKVWPLARWWAVLNWLLGRYPSRIILTLGPADGFLEEFAGGAQRLGVQVVKGIELPRLVAFLSESRLYIGADSGVSHLAAATGTPTVAIFGPTAARVWAPCGQNVHVVQDVWDEGEILAWSPTHAAGPPQGDVMRVVENLLSRP
jgi:heptosyltransferase-3